MSTPSHNLSPSHLSVAGPENCQKSDEDQWLPKHLALLNSKKALYQASKKLARGNIKLQVVMNIHLGISEDELKWYLCCRTLFIQF